MFPKCVERLAGILTVGLRLNKARAKRLAGIVIGAAESKSVLLSELATCIPGNATTPPRFDDCKTFSVRCCWTSTPWPYCSWNLPAS